MGLTATTEADAGPGRSARASRWLMPAAVASLLANIGIVITGGVVRLTGSGLGCPTWPRCSEGSFVAHRAMGVHGAIEFSNRMLTFVVAAVAVATVLVTWRHGRVALTRLAVVLALGVPAQAVIGGVSVLTDLNPWVVSLHLLVSMAMIGLAVALLRRVGQGDGPPQALVPVGARWLARAVFAVGWVVLYLGTMVTGSGPHAGDADSPRNGLDPELLSRLHADAVLVLLALTVALLLAVVATRTPHGVRRAAATLLVVELAQGVVGVVQYYTGLPVTVVAVHLLGAALVSAALTWVLLSVRRRAGENLTRR